MNLKRRRGFSELSAIQEDNIEECYKTLAYAVVEQAAADYKNVLCRIEFDLDTGIKPSSPTVLAFLELQRFFKSEWCGFLCNIEGWDILKALNHQYLTNRAWDWIRSHTWYSDW